MNKKTKALITSIVLSIVAGGGFKIGLPIKDKLIEKLNKIEARQEQYILNQRADMLLRFPRSMVDSVITELKMELYLHDKEHTQ